MLSIVGTKRSIEYHLQAGITVKSLQIALLYMCQSEFEILRKSRNLIFFSFCKIIIMFRLSHEKDEAWNSG